MGMGISASSPTLHHATSHSSAVSDDGRSRCRSRLDDSSTPAAQRLNYTT